MTLQKKSQLGVLLGGSDQLEVFPSATIPK